MAHQKKTNQHHRLPRSQGGSNDDSNISIVNISKHDAYHLLFSRRDSRCMEPHEIAQELNETWIDPKYALVAIPKSRLKEICKKLGI
jgi:hypothetical protein